ncbi:MAG: GNAT family acetyltransferase [Candidatus Goldiibacteriota bacterium]|jgi:ribosomal protein S18 acetylase RimI-like enzyme
MIKIRKYRPEDKHGVIRVWKENFNYTAAYSDPEKSLKQKLRQKDGLLFVADDGGEVAGAIMAGYDGHRGWIYSLAVNKGLRNKGLGSSLLKYAENELIKLGAPKIKLQVMISNKKTAGFYRKHGYEIEEVISMGKKV